MEWWMWLIAITWPFAGIAAFEFTIWDDTRRDAPPQYSRQGYWMRVAGSALIGYILVVLLVLAGFDEMQG